MHARIAWDEDQPGRWYLPSDTDEDYLKQVTAEAKSYNEQGVPVWTPIRRDNHFLDCEHMAYFAMRLTRILPQRPSRAREEEDAGPLPIFESTEPWLGSQSF